jgi:hypothetical protein
VKLTTDHHIVPRLFPKCLVRLKTTLLVFLSPFTGLRAGVDLERQ